MTSFYSLQPDCSVQLRVLDVPVQAPAVEPVSVDEVKLDQRIDLSSFDALIPDYITAHREAAEDKLGRRLITQTWRVEATGWPSPDDVIGLTPYQSATVQYLSGGAWVTLDDSQWSMSVQPNTIALLPARYGTWPTLDDVEGPRVRIDVTCGYGDDAADVPMAIRNWIRARVGMQLQAPTGERASNLIEAPWLDSLLSRYKARY